MTTNNFQWSLKWTWFFFITNVVVGLVNFVLIFVPPYTVWNTTANIVFTLLMGVLAYLRWRDIQKYKAQGVDGKTSG